MSYSSYSQLFHELLARQIRPVGYCEITISSGNIEYVIREGVIKNVTTNTTGDPLSRRLPTEKLQFSLIDYDDIWNHDNPNASPLLTATYPLLCQIRFGIDDNGNTGWGPKCKYYIQTPPDWKAHIASFSGVKKLALWTSIFDKFPTSAFNLGLLYKAVLETVGATQTADGLTTYPVTMAASLDRIQAKDAILQIAAACGRIVMSKDSHTNGAGVFQFDPDDVTNPLLITDYDMLEEPQSEILPLIRAEIIKSVNDQSNPNVHETFLEYSEQLNSLQTVTRHFDFDKLIYGGSQTVTTENMTVLSSKMYKNGYDVEFRPISTSSPVSITIVGAVAKPQILERVQTINANGEEDEVVDCSIMHPTTAWDVATYRGNYLSGTRRSYKFKYRGDPSIDVYDVMRVKLPYVGVVPCIVLEHTFSYDGAFHGELLVRINENAVYDSESAICGIATVGDAVCGTDTV